MTRWNLTAQLDRDDPFEMVLETYHHLRAEGMSWPALLAVPTAMEKPKTCKQGCLRGKENLRGLKIPRTMRAAAVYCGLAVRQRCGK